MMLPQLNGQPSYGYEFPLGQQRNLNQSAPFSGTHTENSHWKNTLLKHDCKVRHSKQVPLNPVKGLDPLAVGIAGVCTVTEVPSTIIKRTQSCLFFRMVCFVMWNTSNHGDKRCDNLGHQSTVTITGVQLCHLLRSCNGNGRLMTRISPCFSPSGPWSPTKHHPDGMPSFLNTKDDLQGF